MFRTLAFLAAALLLGGCVDDESQPTEAERALLLTHTDFGYEEDAGRYGKTVSYLSRSIELTYDSPPLSGLYLHSTVLLTSSPSEAAFASYSALKGASFGLGLTTDDVTEEDIALSRDIGSHARLVLLRKNGKPIGNMFSTSIGKKLIFTVVTGRHHFDSAQAFEAFIEPKLAALEAHEYDDPLVSWGKGLFSDGEDD